MTVTLTHEVQEVAKELKLPVDKVSVVLELLAEGNTIPFIARYRKEKTGALDEVQIHEIETRYRYVTQLAERKEEVKRLIDEQEKLTPELAGQIEAASTLQQVEDLYRPYKQKRRTKAMVAIEQGLEPLAQWLLNEQAGDVEETAAGYLNEEVTDVAAALAGAHEILAQWVSDNAAYREFIRKYMRYNAILKTKLKKEEADPNQVYAMYYDFENKLSDLPAHRTLALNRAEKEEVISVSIEVDEAPIFNYLERHVLSENLPEAKRV